MLRAIEILNVEGIKYKTFDYMDPHQQSGLAQRVSEALNLVPGQLLKTLALNSSSGPLLALVPSDRKLDLKKVAKLAGVKRCSFLARERVEAVTGFKPGGVCPIGQGTVLPTFVDESAAVFEMVVCSGGSIGSQIQLRFVDLVRICDAVVADIT